MLDLRQARPADVILPRTLQLTVAWGASVLFTRRIDPIRSLRVVRGVARLLVQPDGVWLVLCEGDDERVVAVRRGERVHERVGDYEIAIDCEEDDTPVAAREAVVTKDAAFGQFTSIAVHGAILAAVLFYRAPRIDPELSALDFATPTPRPLDLQVDTLQLATEERIGTEEESGKATHKRDDAASVPGATGRGLAPRAARGSRGAPSGQTTHPRYVPFSYEEHSPALDDLWATSMIGVVHRGESSPSPWDGAADLVSDGTTRGVSSGDVAALGDDGFRGLGLSGIGEGGGHGGMGVAWGGALTRGASDEALSMSYAVGRLGRHTVRAPRIVGCVSSVSGRLPAETVQRIVRQHTGQFRACYDKTFGMREHAPEGRVTVRFVIGRDGSVSSASGSGDLPGGEVAACVTRAFSGISFPQPEGGTVTVTYPIVFTPN